jgi:hypothetical protein
MNGGIDCVLLRGGDGSGYEIPSDPRPGGELLPVEDSVNPSDHEVVVAGLTID